MDIPCKRNVLCCPEAKKGLKLCTQDSHLSQCLSPVTHGSHYDDDQNLRKTEGGGQDRVDPDRVGFTFDGVPLLSLVFGVPMFFVFRPQPPHCERSCPAPTTPRRQETSPLCPLLGGPTDEGSVDVGTGQTSVRTCPRSLPLLVSVSVCLSCRKTTYKNVNGGFLILTSV